MAKSKTRKNVAMNLRSDCDGSCTNPPESTVDSSRARAAATCRMHAHVQRQQHFHGFAYNHQEHQHRKEVNHVGQSKRQTTDTSSKTAGKRKASPQRSGQSGSPDPLPSTSWAGQATEHHSSRVREAHEDYSNLDDGQEYRNDMEYDDTESHHSSASSRTSENLARRRELRVVLQDMNNSRLGNLGNQSAAVLSASTISVVNSNEMYQRSHVGVYSYTRNGQQSNGDGRAAQYAVTSMYGLDSESEDEEEGDAVAGGRLRHRSQAGDRHRPQAGERYRRRPQAIYRWLNHRVADTMWEYVTSPVTVLRRFFLWAYQIICQATLLDTWIIARTRQSFRRLWTNRATLFWILLLFLLPLIIAGSTFYFLKSGRLESSQSASSEPRTAVLDNYFQCLIHKFTNFSSGIRKFMDFSSGIRKFMDFTSLFRTELISDEGKSETMASGDESVSVQDATPLPDSSKTDALKTDTVKQMQLENLIRDIVGEEVSHLRSSLKQQRIDEHTALTSEFHRLKGQMEIIMEQYGYLRTEASQLKSMLRNQKERVDDSELGLKMRYQKLERSLLSLEGKVTNLERTHSLLLSSMRNCCRNHSELADLIRHHVIDTLNKFPDTLRLNKYSQYTGFVSWLKSMFVNREDMKTVLRSLESRIDLAVEKSVLAQLQDVTMGNAISKKSIHAIVKDLLANYSADKTGMADYAMESAGGSIVSTRCSETYNVRTAQYSLFGIPFLYVGNSPRTVIQPGMNPGECWPFKGSEGYLVIQLSGCVKPTAFSLEHIPRALAPTGNIDSAPKEFSVWGLDNETDSGIQLGRYTYDQHGDPLQYFAAMEAEPKAYHLVELRVHSNHGHMEFTCVYRFRVHGRLVEEDSCE